MGKSCCIARLAIASDLQSCGPGRVNIAYLTVGTYTIRAGPDVRIPSQIFKFSTSSCFF